MLLNTVRGYDQVLSKPQALVSTQSATSFDGIYRDTYGRSFERWTRCSPADLLRNGTTPYLSHRAIGLDRSTSADNVT